MSQCVAKLNKARKAKNDEFYTMYEDIEKEVSCYPLDTWKDKIIYCNCDDPTFSNFWKFFVNNFKELNLKELHATYKTLDDSSSKHYIYDGNNTQIIDLQCNGDFRSDECVEILKQCDIVVTNPPFSISKEYIETITNTKKDFLIICNKNAVGYKSMFPYIKNGHIKSGYTKWAGGMRFQSNVDLAVKGVPSAFFTTLRVDEPPFIELGTMEYNRNSKKGTRCNFIYMKYDNYDAIEVPFYDLTPIDYKGNVGVPVTFFEKLNRDQFEIIDYISVPRIKGTAIYKRLIIKKR